MKKTGRQNQLKGMLTKKELNKIQFLVLVFKMIKTWGILNCWWYLIPVEGTGVSEGLFEYKELLEMPGASLKMLVPLGGPSAQALHGLHSVMYMYTHTSHLGPRSCQTELSMVSIVLPLRALKFKRRKEKNHKIMYNNTSNVDRQEINNFLTQHRFLFWGDTLLKATASNNTTSGSTAQCNEIPQLEQKILCSLPGGTESHWTAPLWDLVALGNVRASIILRRGHYCFHGLRVVL